MKLKFHWSEQCQAIRTFPPFELDSEQFPELELEMLQVYNAGSLSDRDRALSALATKMQDTPGTSRGETIFSMVAPAPEDEVQTEFVLNDNDHPLLVLTEK